MLHSLCFVTTDSLSVCALPHCQGAGLTLLAAAAAQQSQSEVNSVLIHLFNLVTITLTYFIAANQMKRSLWQIVMFVHVSRWHWFLRKARTDLFG